MTRTPRRILTPVLVTGLLLGGVGLAQGRGGPAGGPAGGYAGGYAPMGPAAAHGPAPMALRGDAVLPMLARLPIGTTVEVAFFDVDPASGGAPVTTLAITVGADSEAAFGAAFAEARAAAAGWEAAYLVVTTSEIRRTIDLPVPDTAELPRRGGDAFALRLLPAGLDDGDTVTVELYDGDPADGGNLLETLSFAYGADSAIGFRAAVEEALEGAAVAVVTSSPRSMTVDLKAVDERAGAFGERAHAFGERAHAVGERLGGVAERMGRMAERLGAAADRWEGAPMAPGMRGRR
jgi:hypothetical protein